MPIHSDGRTKWIATSRHLLVSDSLTHFHSLLQMDYISEVMYGIVNEGIFRWVVESFTQQIRSKHWFMAFLALFGTVFVDKTKRDNTGNTESKM